MTSMLAPDFLERRTRVLVMLLLVYTFNFLDRQILGILAQPIKADLQLSDSQFGQIGGLAFALLYSTLGVPLALLADRTRRSWVIAGSLTIWSGFTAMCGFAGGFWSLFLYRLGVGMGEAGGVAPSYALISGYYPPQERSRAFAIYSLGIPVGLAAGTLLGAYIAALVNWRVAFVTVGVAGIVVAPLFRWLVRDPPVVSDAIVKRVTLKSVFAILACKPAFWLLAFGASCSSLCGYGLALWLPSILMRSYGLDLVTTGQFMASMLLVGGVAGILLGGWLGDRLGSADRGWYARLPAISWLITGPTFAVGLLSPTAAIAWPLLLIPNAMGLLWLGPGNLAIQHLVPAHMRATASGIFLMINNLVGFGAGPWLMGSISEAMSFRFGADALRFAATSCLGFYLIAALLAWLAVKPLRRDWVID